MLLTPGPQRSRRRRYFRSRRGCLRLRLRGRPRGCDHRAACLGPSGRGSAPRFHQGLGHPASPCRGQDVARRRTPLRAARQAETSAPRRLAACRWARSPPRPPRPRAPRARPCGSRPGPSPAPAPRPCRRPSGPQAPPSARRSAGRWRWCPAPSSARHAGCAGTRGSLLASPSCHRLWRRRRRSRRCCRRRPRGVGDPPPRT
mmetsp:Transcript_45088/g.133492  ORF Transcript_45088/g.133492 Transcript_45088/m.133492 type:complete len:202 (+) Transcript_45088:111-716(+)